MTNSRAPKAAGKRKAAPSNEGSSSSSIRIPTLAERLSYLHAPRPFKSAAGTRTANRRMKSLKAVLLAERERDRIERERTKNEKMEVDPTTNMAAVPEDDVPTYASIEAPPSVLPQRRYCDITGLEAPYTDPATDLRYHDKSVYELIKGLSASTAKEYLSARGVNPIVR